MASKLRRQAIAKSLRIQFCDKEEKQSIAEQLSELQVRSSDDSTLPSKCVMKRLGTVGRDLSLAAELQVSGVYMCEIQNLKRGIHRATDSIGRPVLALGSGNSVIGSERLETSRTTFC